MRILLVEDNLDIAHSLKEYLENEAFAVDVENQGDKGSYSARTNEYDCIILDYVLPHKDGGTVCREVRASGKTTPIIMLTVCDDEKQKVSLLNDGADDYVTKPFSYEELRARIRALMRRPREIETNETVVDTLVLDRTKQRVTRSGHGVYLTKKEFSLLDYMMRHKGSIVSRGMLMEHVWGADTNPFSNTIEAHILNLRKKIDPIGKSQKLIHSIPGRGYKLDVRR